MIFIKIVNTFYWMSGRINKNIFVNYQKQFIYKTDKWVEDKCWLTSDMFVFVSSFSGFLGPK